MTHSEQCQTLKLMVIQLRSLTNGNIHLCVCISVDGSSVLALGGEYTLRECGRTVFFWRKWLLSLVAILNDGFVGVFPGTLTETKGGRMVNFREICEDRKSARGQTSHLLEKRGFREDKISYRNRF